jgi:hypothetical protein
VGGKSDQAKFSTNSFIFVAAIKFSDCNEKPVSMLGRFNVCAHYFQNNKSHISSKSENFPSTLRKITLLE